MTVLKGIAMHHINKIFKIRGKLRIGTNIGTNSVTYTLLLDTIQFIKIRSQKKKNYSNKINQKTIDKVIPILPVGILPVLYIYLQVFEDRINTFATDVFIFFSGKAWLQAFILHVTLLLQDDFLYFSLYYTYGYIYNNNKRSLLVCLSLSFGVCMFVCVCVLRSKETTACKAARFSTNVPSYLKQSTSKSDFGFDLI